MVATGQQLAFQVLCTFPIGFFWLVLPGIFWAKCAPFHPFNAAMVTEFRQEHAVFYGPVALMGNTGADVFRMLIGLAEGFVGCVCFASWAETEVAFALAVAGCFLGGFITLNGTAMHHRFATKYASKYPLLAKKHAGGRAFCGTVSTLHWIVFIVGMTCFDTLTDLQSNIIVGFVVFSACTWLLATLMCLLKGTDPDASVEELLKQS